MWFLFYCGCFRLFSFFIVVSHTWFCALFSDKTFRCCVCIFIRFPFAYAKFAKLSLQNTIFSSSFLCYFIEPKTTYYRIRSRRIFFTQTCNLMCQIVIIKTGKSIPKTSNRFSRLKQKLDIEMKVFD